MYFEDDVYSQIKSEFIYKSVPSTYTYIFAALVLYSVLHTSGLLGLLTGVILVAIIVFNLLRYLIYFGHKTERIKINTAVKQTCFIVLLNAISWLLYGVIILYTQHFLLDHIVLFLFLFLVGFSIGSISSLYWNWPLLFFINLCFTFPIVFYSVFRTIDDHLYDRLSVLIIFFINVGFVYFNSKITLKENNERIKASEELKRSLKELDLRNRELEIETFNKLQASKSASLVDFASGISHEINNPLTIIEINTNKLIESNDHNFTPDQVDRLNKISQSSERIEKIINGLKNVTNSIPFESFAKYKLGIIIDSVLEIYLDKARLNNIKILHDDYPPIDVLCVAPQVSHIIINILENAIDSIIKNRKGNNIYIKFLEEENFLKLRIVNDGPPIDNETANKMFQPFFTTKEVGKGPGLGLTLARSLATGNGGALTYEVYQGKPSFVLSVKKFKV